jgi:hypothetical protein
MDHLVAGAAYRSMVRGIATAEEGVRAGVVAEDGGAPPEDGPPASRDQARRDPLVDGGGGCVGARMPLAGSSDPVGDKSRVAG